MATPNMNLVELVPGITTGPQYATDIVSNFSTIDAHDHTTGNGTRIPSAGININSNLEYNGNAPIGQGKSQFNSLGAALSAAGDYRSLHVVAGELFYLDDSGNSVQLTNSGSVAGSAGNITGLSSPASVTFSTNKYVFKDTATSFGILESADVRLFEDSASAITNYVGLKSPASLAATYNLTFPGALPAATRYVASDNTGALTFETADSIGSAMTSTGANAIAATRTRTTGTTVGAGGIAISASSGDVDFTTSTPTDIPNFSVTITTSGRPVRIVIIPDGGTSVYSTIGIRQFSSSTVLSATGRFDAYRDAVQIGTTQLSCFLNGGSNTLDQLSISRPPSDVEFIDTPPAGTYTYKIQAFLFNVGGSDELNILNCRLMVYEL